MPRLPFGYEDAFAEVKLKDTEATLNQKFNKYIGMKLYSFDGKFIGNININKYDMDSIVNI